MRHWLLFCWLGVLCSTFSVQAQSSDIPIGTWRLHLPHYRAKAIAETPDAVYCVTEDSFFKLVKETNALQTLSRTNGLHDVNVSTIRYDSASATLVVVYENTNIDLIQNGKAYNMTDLLRKSLSGSKNVYHLYTHAKKAYVATNFGLVVVDLARNEIKDTYSNLGPQGESVEVYASAVLNDSVYITSSAGVMAASLTKDNLLDYRSWRRFSSEDGLELDAQVPKTIVAFQKGVYVGVPQVGMYRYNGTNWQKASISTTSNTYRSLEANAGRLLVTGAQEIVEVTSTSQVSSYANAQFQDLRTAMPARAGEMWIADYQKGLLRLEANQIQAYVPNGPASVDVFSLYADKDTVTALAGGFDASYLSLGSSAGFYQWQQGQWKNYNMSTVPQFPATAQDFVTAIKNPVTGAFYLASYGGGLLEWTGPEQFTLYNEENSPLLSSVPGDQRYVRITGLAVDRAGSTWVVNRNQISNAPGLFERKPDGTWIAHTIPYNQGSNLEEIILDDQGYKWLSVSKRPGSAGLLVYDDLTQKYRYLGGAGIGNLPNLQINSMALDLNGEVWVGTGNGVAVFANPANIFSAEEVAYLPVFEQRPLLQGQIVQSITIDGANRKWIGTNMGLWLFNETGEKLISNFTTENSPLPSNQVKDIAINPSSGEVFVATAAGIVSYRGTATRTEVLNKNCLQVFPNPVRVGFTGTIGISGIPDNGWVKITDAAGLLVYEAIATGGTFAWNGIDYKGHRAKAGVYVVLATSADGTQTCTAKIAVQ